MHVMRVQRLLHAAVTVGPHAGADAASLERARGGAVTSESGKPGRAEEEEEKEEGRGENRGGRGDAET